MVAYTFVYGVDGIDVDIAPAYEEGVFIDYNKAFKKQIELNKFIFEEEDKEFEVWNSDDDDYLTLRDLKRICEYLNNDLNELPCDWYRIVEVEIVDL